MFSSLMHVAFYTEHFDEMMNFYTNKLGLPVKVLTRFSSYRDSSDRPAMQKAALENPDRIFNAYIELAPGQFIELFPERKGQVRHEAPDGSEFGYAHFALTTEDIYQTRQELEARGVVFDTGISKGPSGTYQMWTHDPDGNRFEIMQYTEESYQVTGHID